MNLTIDIGNSSISGAFFYKEKKLNVFSVSHDQFFKKSVYHKFNHIYPTDVIISSVVPTLTKKVVKLFKSFSISTSVFPDDFDITLKSKYESLTKIGADRLTCICGCMEAYSVPFLVIDFGTAITFDYVDSKGVYRGGFILPGIETSFNALKQNTALLPKETQLCGKVDFPARNTKSCMRSGTVLGFAEMTDGLINRFKALSKKKLSIVATGGNAQLLLKHFKSKMTYRADLILEALAAMV